MATGTSESIILELQKKIASILGDYQNTYIPKAEKELFARIIKLTSKFKLTSNGRIKPIGDNLKVVNEIKSSIDNYIGSGSYQNALEDVLGLYEVINEDTNAYFSKVLQEFEGDSFNLKRASFYKAITKNSQEITLDRLAGSGIKETLVNPLGQVLQQGITGASSYEDMVNQVHDFILGTKDVSGALNRNAFGIAKQSTWDTLQQYQATYTDSISSDLDFEFYKYSTGEIKTTRSFCREREGKYFHRKEIESWANESWAGKASGTNETTIFIYRGGYNCRHQFIPVPTSSVPKSVINKAIQKGWYKK